MKATRRARGHVRTEAEVRAVRTPAKDRRVAGHGRTPARLEPAGGARPRRRLTVAFPSPERRENKFLLFSGAGFGSW